MITMRGDEEMENNSDLDGHDPTRVNRLTIDDLRERTIGESPRVPGVGVDAADTVNASPVSVDGLPARRIELRYWIALLAIGVAIWAAFFYWIV